MPVTGLSTQRIAKLPLGSLRQLSNPDEQMVSSVSRFRDAIWRLDNLTPGQSISASTMTWGFRLDDGSTFSAPKYDGLRYQFKRFAWSLFSDPRHAPALMPGSAMTLNSSIRYLAKWMVKNEYDSFCELDNEASECFLEDVVLELEADRSRKGEMDGSDDGPELVGDEEDGESHTPKSSRTECRIRVRLISWGLLWRQTDALRDAGIPSLPEAPFGGRPIKKVAKSLAAEPYGWIRPLPDEIALPIMSQAHRIIGTPAEDVIRLAKEYAQAFRDASEYSAPTQLSRALQTLRRFTFSVIAGEAAPWRAQLNSSERRLRYHGGVWEEREIPPHQVLRTLVEHVCAASAIVILGDIGLRRNELSGLQSGRDQGTGLPVCVEMRRSISGLSELFFLKGKLSKTKRVPERTEWLMGSRPVGSSEVPAPVRAVSILQDLYEPIRSLSDSKAVRSSLIVGIKAAIGYPRVGKAVKRIEGATILKFQKNFIGNFVNLSDLPDSNRYGEDLSRFRDSRGGSVGLHAWRKTFARYVFRLDSRMVPAIAQQFQHLSLAMTEEGYIGNDRTLLEVLESVRLEQTYRFFHEIVNGKKPAAGRLAKLIEEHRVELQRQFNPVGAAPTMGDVERWVLAQDIRIWFVNHGKCLFQISPIQAKCHEKAGTSHWANSEPNVAHRSPDTCLGCPLFAVDRDHEMFWKERYLQNQTAWKSAENRHVLGEFRVAKSRAEQSAMVLRAIGAELPNEVAGE